MRDNDNIILENLYTGIILKEKDFQIELIEGQVRIKMDQQDSALINIGNKFKNASKGIKCITNTAYCTFCTL